MHPEMLVGNEKQRSGVKLHLLQYLQVVCVSPLLCGWNKLS